MKLDQSSFCGKRHLQHSELRLLNSSYEASYALFELKHVCCSSTAYIQRIQARTPQTNFPDCPNIYIG